MFKALTIYSMTTPWSSTAGALESLLAEHPRLECTGQTAHTQGWIELTPEGQLSFGHELHILARHGTETKILPSSVVKREAEKKAKEIEGRMGFKPGRKQMREIKEQVASELLPKAFAKQGQTTIWIDPLHRRLMVGSTSASSADRVTASLRDVLGELPIEPIKTKVPLSDLMTQWVRGSKAPEHFDLDGDAELVRVSDESPTVRYVRHTLDGPDVRDHLDNQGKVVRRLSLCWRDRVRFSLSHDFQITKIRFSEVSDLESDVSKTKETSFELDAAFALGELSSLLNDLSAVCMVEAPDSQS